MFKLACADRGLPSSRKDDSRVTRVPPIPQSLLLRADQVIE